VRNPRPYFQLCLSWKHEDPIRRHYYDSGAKEGIGFYAEEMMLQAGCSDDSPHTARDHLQNYMRLRALRVEVDVRLALGELPSNTAAKYLEEKVPMESGEPRARKRSLFPPPPARPSPIRSANSRSRNFSPKPSMQRGDKFSLRAFHDFVWKNGNIPIALQRWEYVGGPEHDSRADAELVPAKLNQTRLLQLVRFDNCDAVAFRRRELLPCRRRAGAFEEWRFPGYQ